MIRALTLALTLHMSAAHGAPPKVDSKAVATAKAHLASAKTELKAAKTAERAHKTEIKRAKRHRIKAEHDRITALPDDAPELGLQLGCGTCLDDGPDACDCSEVTAPTEEKCRAIATKGETWEDACERVYHVSPDAWDLATGVRK